MTDDDKPGRMISPGVSDAWLAGRISDAEFSRLTGIPLMPRERPHEARINDHLVATGQGKTLATAVVETPEFFAEVNAAILCKVCGVSAGEMCIA